MTLTHREAATEAGTPLAEGEPPVVPPFACETCGAGMQAGQDWCLDCGTAAPGRLGARPGWRSAFTVVGVTLLLLVGAVAASYAALTGDAQREAARPSAGDGNPITAQTPGVGPPTAPATPGATGPGTVPPKPPAAPGPTIGPPQPPQPPASTPLTGGGASTPLTGGGATPAAPPGAGSSPSSPRKKDSGATRGPQPIKLSTGAARLYDPDKRAGAEFGPAANAVDGSASSVWDVTVPVDREPLGVGLVIDLGARYALKSLKISTPTPGFDLELYGAKGTRLPPDILDSRWDHLTDRVNYADGKSIALKGRAKVRLLGLWFAEAGLEADPRVAIGDVKVFGTK